MHYTGLEPVDRNSNNKICALHGDQNGSVRISAAPTTLMQALARTPTVKQPAGCQRASNARAKVCLTVSIPL